MTRVTRRRSSFHGYWLSIPASLCSLYRSSPGYSVAPIFQIPVAYEVIKFQQAKRNFTRDIIIRACVRACVRVCVCVCVCVCLCVCLPLRSLVYYVYSKSPHVPGEESCPVHVLYCSSATFYCLQRKYAAHPHPPTLSSQKEFFSSRFLFRCLVRLCRGFRGKFPGTRLLGLGQRLG